MAKRHLQDLQRSLRDSRDVALASALCGRPRSRPGHEEPLNEWLPGFDYDLGPCPGLVREPLARIRSSGCSSKPLVAMRSGFSKCPDAQASNSAGLAWRSCSRCSLMRTKANLATTCLELLLSRKPETLIFRRQPAGLVPAPVVIVYGDFRRAFLEPTPSHL